MARRTRNKKAAGQATLDPAQATPLNPVSTPVEPNTPLGMKRCNLCGSAFWQKGYKSHRKKCENLLAEAVTQMRYEEAHKKRHQGTSSCIDNNYQSSLTCRCPMLYHGYCVKVRCLPSAFIHVLTAAGVIRSPYAPRC